MTPNEDLRDHVTATGFALMLGKTHIAALVALDQMLKAGGRHHFRERPGSSLRHFVTGVRGLESRGLIEHTPPPKSDMPVRRIWKITKAGRYVIGLLHESGLYEEYLPQFEIYEGGRVA